MRIARRRVDERQDKDGKSPRIMLSRRLVWDADGWPKAVAEKR